MNPIKKEAKHLISFLEKWTESDVVYFFQGGAWLFSAQLALVITSLLLSIGFAHLAGKEVYGQFQFVLAMLGTLSVLAFPGANAAVMLGTAQKKEGTLLQGVLYKLKRSILGVIGIFSVAAYFYLQHEPNYAQVWPALLVTIVFFPILYSLDVTQHFFVGKRKFSWSSLFQLMSHGGSALAALAALFFTTNIIVILVVYLGAQAVSSIFAFRFARKRMRNKHTDPEFSSYSNHMTAINFIPTIRAYFDKLIVTYTLGFASTAVYSIAAAMSEQLFAISRNVANIAFPKLAVQSEKKLYGEVKRRTGKLVVFFVLIAGVAILLAPYLIPFFFSEQYSSAIPIAQFLLLAGIPRAVGFILVKVQEAMREKKKMYAINLVFASVEILALLVLVPLYGLNGIIGAKAISNTTYVIMAWRSLR